MGGPAETENHPRLKILVVEDDSDTSRHLCHYLEKLGHQVSQTSCVEHALQALASSNYDVLLSDIGLPDGNGWDLLRRAHLPASVHAIAMSGYGTQSDINKSREAGYRHHLIKPFPIKTLSAHLKQALIEKR